MEKLTILKYQAEIIANALRLTANIYGCRDKKYKTIKDPSSSHRINAETAWDREVIRAEKFINEILKTNN